MSRRVLWQGLLGGATLLGVIAAVELGARVHRALVCPGSPPTFSVPDRHFGWTHPASTTVHAFGCAGSRYEWATTATFNAQGLNDSPHSYDRAAAGPLRVLVLGDSATEALQVPRPDNFSERLQAMLAQRGRAVEVINAGHSGYGTDNELFFFLHEGVRYHPDVVLLAFNLQNDVAENSSAIVQRMYSGGPRRPKADVRVAGDGRLLVDTSAYERFEQQWNDRGWAVRPPMPWLRNNSFFVRRLYDVFLADRSEAQAAPGAAYPVHFDVYRTPDAADWSQAWTLTDALVGELRNAVEAAGGKLVVAILPSHETVDPERWKNFVAMFPALAGSSWDLDLPRRRILGILGAQHVEYVDTTPLLRQHLAAGGGPDYFDFDPHPNAGGHRLIAQAVLPAVEHALATRAGAAAAASAPLQPTATPVMEPRPNAERNGEREQ